MKKSKKNNNLQNIYNIVNAILPIMSIASLLAGRNNSIYIFKNNKSRKFIVIFHANRFFINISVLVCDNFLYMDYDSFYFIYEHLYFKGRKK